MIKVNTTKIDNNLLYRRQYFIGPQFVDRFESWNKIKVGKNIHITAHPDLTVTTTIKGDTELALLGFVFDSKNPLYSNKQILESMLIQSNSFQDIIKLTYPLAGRWIIIYSSNYELKLLHDPSGLRQIFYSKIENELWCASQPHILASIFNIQLAENPDIHKYMKSKLFDLWERAWIGNGTAFNNIFHLIPNHFLDINLGQTIRYWPDQEIEELYLEEVAVDSKNILENLFIAALNRYQIAQAVTSGWDTRLMLSISKNYTNDIYYFVQSFPPINESSTDITVPKKIFNKLGIDFHIINANICTEEFEKIYFKNVYIAQSDHKKYQHYNYFQYFQDKLVISGNVGPLIRNMIPPNLEDINPHNLARLMNRHNQRYAINAIDVWLQQANELKNKFNVNLVKLFYWENHFGNWSSMYNSALDIATEEFAPLNCRNLILKMLAIKSCYREYHPVLLYEKIITNSWPELLDFPINPHICHNSKNTIKKSLMPPIMETLRKIGLYKYVRSVYRKTIYN